MLLSIEQCKYLETDGDEQYRFVGNGKATEQEKEQLKELDESYLDVYGFHMITNYKDLG